MSLKAYFTHGQAKRWFAQVAEQAVVHPAILTNELYLFVLPTYLQILPAIEEFSGTPVQVGAQNISEFNRGPITGEVTACELAEIGASVAAVGHAERRKVFFEDDTSTALKAAAALRAGLTPVICVGESERVPANQAARTSVDQLVASLSGTPTGPVIVAYEPVWAIGSTLAAPDPHIIAVIDSLRSSLYSDPSRHGSRVIYGGAAGPGMLTRLGNVVDGLFLGRHAHDVDALFAVVDEAYRQLK
ncbi:triose-phosphate isomerase [Plantibacter sp. Mn2098]|uniref:triose-phosphate isomerase n=1 Tax=Plantibacter sp. Mn2098 TaxID=3395266 RepID=UPI003BC5BCF7